MQIFTVAGQRVAAFRDSEGYAILTALQRLSTWGSPQEPGEELPQPACADLLEQTLAALENIAAADFILTDSQTVSISALPTYIPEVDDGRRNAWMTDPQYAAIATYAPGGVLVEASEAAVLQTAAAAETSIANGRCAWRTRWGLVGAVAILGAAVLAGGAYIYDRAKKPGRRR
jgi:hypothetical protein